MGSIDCVVVYDVADDRRRGDVSRVLSAFGPRVQFSVFECMFTSAAALQSALAQLTSLIDPLEDQIRLYQIAGSVEATRTVLGTRTLEERVDFWIV